MIRWFTALSILLLMSSCMRWKDLEIKQVDGFALKRLDPKGMESQLQLRILNPNAVGFKLLPSTFDVKYSGINLGQAKLMNKVRIKGKEEQVYSFDLYNDFKEVNILDLMGLIQPGGFKNEILITGELKASKWLIRKKFKVEYKDKISLQ